MISRHTSWVLKDEVVFTRLHFFESRSIQALIPLLPDRYLVLSHLWLVLPDLQPAL